MNASNVHIHVGSHATRPHLTNSTYYSGFRLRFPRLHRFIFSPGSNHTPQNCTKIKIFIQRMTAGCPRSQHQTPILPLIRAFHFRAHPVGGGKSSSQTTNALQRIIGWRATLSFWPRFCLFDFGAHLRMTNSGSNMNMVQMKHSRC